MDLTFTQRNKEVQLTWDTGIVKGATAEVTAVPANQPPGAPIETIETANDGRCLLVFGPTVSGEVNVTVNGSHDGSQTGSFVLG